MIPGLPFWKMHGCGNDFVVCQINSSQAQSIDSSEIVRICDRHFGVGADGVMIVGDSSEISAGNAIPVIMKNPDGSDMGMCGNGIRCAARFVEEYCGVSRPQMDFDVEGNQISVTRSGDLWSVDMGAPSNESAEMSFEVLDRKYPMISLSVPNPHCVIFMDRPLKDDELHSEGARIENHERFPNRTNVEFVQVKSSDAIIVQMWERGAGATLACGTGACAAVVAGVTSGRLASDVSVALPGGTLRVKWNPGENVILMGPATKVFEGAFP